MDWERWDRQIELDSASGKLDFLIKEAVDTVAKNAIQFYHLRQ